MQPPVKVGVIGCGDISRAYLENARTFHILDVVACADLYLERAQERAQEFHIPRACTVAELLADPEIELVINLTIPAAHAEIGLAALEAGKCVYNEKPLAIVRKDAQRMLGKAADKHLLVGCAPDTFLGGGLQTCRKVIDDGEIGEPIAASAFMLSHGHENWHPDPAFYYRIGGGPMFDMGPYYLTALIALMGPIRRVTGSTKITFPTRTITSEPHAGDEIEVTTPTHITGIMDFASGAIGTISTSFDVWSTTLPPIEIYGTQGTLLLPDPNTFGGPVRMRKAGEHTWRDVPLTHGYTKNSRGIGAADMAYALRSGRPHHRANGELAYHVLDTMCAFEDASHGGKHTRLTSTCVRPEPLPPGLAEQM
jgi:predicted dehydrogenase